MKFICFTKSYNKLRSYQELVYIQTMCFLLQAIMEIFLRRDKKQAKFIKKQVCFFINIKLYFRKVIKGNKKSEVNNIALKICEFSPRL